MNTDLDAPKAVTAQPARVGSGDLFPVLLCRLIGHKWHFTHVSERTIPGYRVTETVEAKACRRCGMPNPNHLEGNEK